YSVDDLESGMVSRGRMVRVVLAFISGFTVVFAAFGATATSLGRALASNLPVVSRVAGAVVVLFGLLIVGLAFSNRGILGFFDRDARPRVRPSKLGAWAAPAMGAAFAFGWTPCIGPILTVVLATAATTETVTRGIVLLVSYSLGLGLPFLLAALGLHRLFRRLRPYLRPLNVAAGITLTAFGVVMLTGNLNRISSFVTEVMSGIPFLERLAQI
ncbi:MAG: cytochrome c biogenesis CcdA family protein, partial [Acidimicrobiia bacterium]|nr:cytochrome c biogenesis CcdA family protein [Acidimicrobiia bacterium]